MIPKQIGRFEIVGQIGSGAAGPIYRARDPKFDRKVAIRVVAVQDAGTPAAQRLLQQAKDASALQSPNIATILGGGELQGGFYVVMEYVEGISLRARMLDKRPSPYEVLDYCRQACIALDHAAARGIVHRNLTPDNIVVEWDGTLKVLDFGIPEEEGTSSTASPNYLERLRYRSPEQVRGEPLDRRSNLYSWGAMLHEMVTGTPLCSGATVDELRRQILEETPTRPQLAPPWSAGVSAVISKATTKAREERYSSGAELIRELEIQQRQPARLAPGAAAAPKATAAAREAVVPTALAAASPRVLAASLTQASVTTPSPAPPVASSPEPAPGQQPAGSQRARLAQVGTKTVRLVRMVASRKIAGLPYPTALRVAAAALLLVSVSLASGLYLRRQPARPTPPAAVSAPVAPLAAPPASEQPPTLPEDTSMTAVVPNAPARPHARTARVPVAAPPQPPAITTGDVAVTSTPPGAEIQVDGRHDPEWVTPRTLNNLNAGQHTISVAKAGYAPQSHTVQVAAGNRAIVAVSLAELPAILTVASEPAGAAIVVDGHDSGRTTPSKLEVAKGAHTLLLRKSGYFDASTATQLDAGQNFGFAPTLKPMGNAASIQQAGKVKKFFGAAPKDMASIQIKTRPKGARVTVNERQLEKTTPLEFFLEPGNYDIAITLDGYKPLRRSVTLLKDNKIVIDEALEK